MEKRHQIPDAADPGTNPLTFIGKTMPSHTVKIIVIGLCIALILGVAIYAQVELSRDHDPGIIDQSEDGKDDPGISGNRPSIIVSGLDIPWSIDWLPDGTMLFTERRGVLSSWDGENKKELLRLDVAGGEGGLLGLAVDPGFDDNGFIYLYYTHDISLANTENRVVRYILTDLDITEDKVLVDKIPGSFIHDGGRIQLGPDGKLYIATGDAAMPRLAQDESSLAGKILRINSDGSIPGDNPIPGSPVYTTGHRNPQGMDWDESGRMVITEHGPSGLDTGRDEINVIIPGGNYGWPHVTGDETRQGLQSPVYHTGDNTWAPSGSEFYYGDKIPEWKGKYVVASLRGQSLYVLDVDLENNTVIPERWYYNEFGRLRDVQTGPDEYLYVLTSNGNDDTILRIPGE